ncbi:MAG: hypothetical protein WC121_11500 [Candidatus Kapaibacterium sp.]
MKQNKITLFLVLIMTLSFVSCSESIVSECEPDTKVDNQMKASFKEIQEKVITPSCATSGCHQANFYSPNLEDGKSYDNIVGVNNLADNMPLIDPGNSTNSYFFKKLLGDGTTLMPSGGDKLNKAILDSIRVWIDNGAENN